MAGPTPRLRPNCMSPCTPSRARCAASCASLKSTRAGRSIGADTLPLCSGGPDRSLGGRLGFGQAGRLVDADDIACGVAKCCDYLARMGVDVMDDFATRRLDYFNRLGGTRNHDVNHQSGLGRDGPPEDPRPAHLVDGIVESRRAVASLSDLPSEGTVVELGRLLDVLRGNLDVADLSGSVRGWLNRCAHSPDAKRAASRGRCSWARTRIS